MVRGGAGEHGGREGRGATLSNSRVGEGGVGREDVGEQGGDFEEGLDAEKV